MRVPLIVTKLHPPRLNSRVIARPRLLAQLHEQPQRHLTLVIAPAGFGKTTVVAQWLFETMPSEGGTAQVAWLVLDAEDSVLERCWRYLIAAIQQVFPTSCADSVALLDAQQQPPPRYLADVLANDLAALPGPLVLVLDDYHQITSQDVHDALMRLIVHLPAHVHLVLISRTSVPWSLGRLRGQGQLVELRAADLCFTTAEVRELLQRTLDTGPLDEVATLLHTRTEGWAVGLQLACLSLQAAPDSVALARGLCGTSRHIADYLLDEVLNQQPEALQQMLLVSALPDRFCPELCAYLLEEASVDAAQALIARIERQGLFLVVLDDTDTWYRYHTLVRDLLVFRLTEVHGDAAVTALHRRCSAWFAARGLIEEAVRHALLAGDQTLATDLVAESYRELFEHDDGLNRISTLLALLPKPLILGSPRLLLASAFDYFLRLDMVAFAAITEQVVARLTEDTAADRAEAWADLRGEIALLQSIACLWTGDFVRATALTEEACRHIPQTHISLYALAVMTYEATLFHRGEPNRSTTLVGDRLGLDCAPTNAADGTLLVGIAYMSLLGGQLDQMARAARQMIGDRLSGNRFFSCYGQYLLGLYHYERNDLEAAEGCFVQASRFPYHIQDQVYHDSLLGLARIALAHGERERATDYGRRARSFAEERTSHGLLEASSAYDASLALAQGDHVAAIWLVQLIDPTPHTGHSLWQEQTCWCQARVQIAQAMPASLAEAERNLTRYLAEAESAHNLAWQIRAGALLAVAHDAQGAADAALATLQGVVVLAAPRGFLRSLLDCGPPLAELLRRLVPSNPYGAYIAQVLAMFHMHPGHELVVVLGSSVRVKVAALAPSRLTEREQEILVFLVERLTDKEIAAQLHISITTVRTHTRNLYGKLEVNDRRMAISRAREIGLLAATPPRT